MSIKSKIPKKIRVGGIDYKIVLKEKFEDDTEHWGGCRYDLARIEIVTISDAEEIADCTLLSNLFHELCHAIDVVYCGYLMSESMIEKIATFWFQLLSDNYFFMKRKELPDKIKIQGISYDVTPNHEFDCVGGNPTVGIKMGNLSIRCIDDEKTVCNQVVKRNLIVCLVRHFVNSNLFSDEEREKFNLESFGSGLYQVLKDTNLNDLIREVC